ncbi:uncharacterized protein LOC108041465 [Drosophila rhopaloa]|uniref:Golgi-associated plant pathogenesis-related protein 1 n=2 Tax=Drosophila rhopaloa TaxID=1041015 RepID=A0ABM5H5K4_DRORH|nr:uncharacterized protein LOC108041465 [Drosophila rhopaloa]
MFLFIFLVASELYQNCLGHESIKEEVLIDHNEHRRNWLVPELIVSDSLSEDCEAYAKHLVTLKIPDQKLYKIQEKSFVDQLALPLSDPLNPSYTENICEFVNNNCVKYWSTQGARCYGMSKKRRNKHEQSLADKFSAITWKSSSSIGIGWAPKNPANKNGRKILVVRYSPPGNIPGEYDQNLENPDFLDYYTLSAVNDEEMMEVPKTSGGSRDGPLGNQIDITLLVLIFEFRNRPNPDLEGRATSDPWSQIGSPEFHNGVHSSPRTSQVWRPTWNPTPIWRRQEASFKPTFLVEILSNLLGSNLFRETVFACIPNEAVRLKENAENSAKSMPNELLVLVLN